MSAEVVRVGAVARLDPNPERELEAWRADLAPAALDDPAETRERLAAHERGEYVIVELALFADVLEGSSLRRIDGVEVPGLWFARPGTRENVLHASEVATDRLDALRADLAEHGLAVDLATLTSLPIRIEIDDALEQALL